MNMKLAKIFLPCIVTLFLALSFLLAMWIDTRASVEGFDAELGKYVRDGFVDYESWSKDRGGLDSFIESLENVDLESLSDDESKALLINAYNAFMVWLILEHYPISGVLDIEPKVFEQKKLKLGGKMVSLDNIEHNRLRKMGDPRIHFAIVCGSKGCPDLSSEAYKAQELDRQLDSAARRYLAQPKGLRVESDRSIIYLSKIFEWFGDDFGENQSEKLRALSRYAPEEYRDLLDESSELVKVKYMDYDWSLNGK